MRSPVLGFLLVLAHAPAHAGTCDGARASADRIQAEVARIEDAWSSMDPAAVQRGGADLLGLVACAGTPLSPELSARIHRSLGLVAITRGEQEAAAAAFSAARAADPALALTEALAPSGSVVARLYERPFEEIPSLPLDRPAAGALLVDGRRTREISPVRPAVLQHLTPGGAVAGTWWLDDPRELPVEPWLDPSRAARGRARVAGVASIALGVAALGAAGASASAHADRTAPHTARQLATYRDASRVGTVVGGGLLIGGSAAFALSYTGVFR